MKRRNNAILAIWPLLEKFYCTQPLIRQSKWEVVVSEWSPADDGLVAVAANNKVELLSLTGSELVLDTSLRAHTRDKQV